MWIMLNNNSFRKKTKCIRYRIGFINDLFFLLVSRSLEVLLHMRTKPGWKHLINFIVYEFMNCEASWLYEEESTEKEQWIVFVFSLETKIYLPEVLHLCFGECNDIQYPRCIREGVHTLQVGFNGPWWHFEVLEVPFMVSQSEKWQYNTSFFS